MCVTLMGPGGESTMAGKAMIRALHRAIRDYTEDELRQNLTEIRDVIDAALNAPQTVPLPTGDHSLDTMLNQAFTDWENGEASYDGATLYAGE